MASTTSAAAPGWRSTKRVSSPGSRTVRWWTAPTPLGARCGELPFLLAQHPSARQAVDAFVAQINPQDYNPAWLLVGDRTDLFYLDVTTDDRVLVEELAAGTHVLENRSLHEPSTKTARVRALLEQHSDANGHVPRERITRLLGDHDRPPDEAEGEATSRVASEARAICVHDMADDYGTRSSTIITIAGDDARLPDVAYTDGPPCRQPWQSAEW